MKILLTGSRTLQDTKENRELIAKHLAPATVVIHGGAAGADNLAAKYAAMTGKTEIVITPDYEKMGVLAPIIRNQKMVKMAEIVVAIYDGKRTAGTAGTVKYAIRQGKQVTEIITGADAAEQKTLW